MEADNKKSTKSLIICAVLAIIIVTWFKGCGCDSGKTTTITTKEVKGAFAPSKPTEKVIEAKKVEEDIQNIFKPKTDKQAKFWRSESERLLDEYNKLDEAFKNYNDSVQQAKYREVIAPKLFTRTWDNEDLEATVNGVYLGLYIPNIELEYKIKPRTIEVPKQKEVVFRMLGGVEVGATKEIDKFNLKASAGFQNRKGNIISVGYDTDQRIYVGYTTSIFSIKAK